MTSESQKALKKKNDGVCQRDTKEKVTKRTPSCQSQDNLSNKVNAVALDYSPKNKINVYEFILI